RAHLSGCSSCRNLIADLTSIVATAHLLPAEVEPPARVWTSLRVQLEEEGIIRSAATRSRWLSFSEFFRPRVFATAAVGLLIVAAAALQFQRPATQPTEARNAYENLYQDTSLTLNNDEAHLPAMQLAGNTGTDISLRQNLDIVDKFIVDCEQRVKEQPQDELTREYLSGAYQEKAELISAMMERRGSGN
ncbi:MAG TPA: hypothetical protein VNY81_08180, partial [Candidatus Saccharimonadales bacterium]|nr:hypothetical protein [Candidatus Saccharimonadales bacterium]